MRSSGQLFPSQQGLGCSSARETQQPGSRQSSSWPWDSRTATGISDVIGRGGVAVASGYIAAGIAGLWYGGWAAAALIMHRRHRAGDAASTAILICRLIVGGGLVVGAWLGAAWLIYLALTLVAVLAMVARKRNAFV